MYTFKGTVQNFKSWIIIILYGFIPITAAAFIIGICARVICWSFMEGFRIIESILP